jgi:RND family efflux transporter MFP subunit
MRSYGAVSRPLRVLFDLGTVGELTDGQLLERFATARAHEAELAFGVLVERHGAMVLRVCRGVLGNSSEAEDAFQGTFLVLVKQGRALWVRESLGPWLHQVAYRTALGARRSLARRRRVEERFAVRVHASGAIPAIDAETGHVLHEEIERLPERFRAPVVLCDLEGRSHEEAARELGWPIGTVKSRQSRGRARLRARLVRRGFGPERVGVVGVMGFSLPGRSVLVSPALVQATAELAIRLGVVRGVAGGAAVSLMQGVLRAMWITHLVKVGSVVVASGALTLGAGLVSQVGVGGGQGAAEAGRPKDREDKSQGLAVEEVRRGAMVVNVEGRARLESSVSHAVHNNVSGKATILKILPEGRRVKAGEVVGELDSAFLKDLLDNQTIPTRRAESAYNNAKLAREVAEITVREYTEGIMVQDQASLKNNVAAASGALKRAESRLARTRQTQQQLTARAIPNDSKRPADFVAELELVDRLEASEQAIAEGKAALELAKSKLENLEKFTSVKTLKSLSIDVEEKRAEELEKKRAWEREKATHASLERQIASCVLKAPGDGVVVYSSAQIEEGGTVRERQVILSVVDTSQPMLAVMYVPELLVDKLKEQMKAKVRVDSFSDMVLEGTVVDVAPKPDRSVQDKLGKVYLTKVKLDKAYGGLRPGMSAGAEIFVDRHDDALIIPQGSLVYYDDSYHVAIKRADGGIEWRAVKLGLANGTDAEIKEGAAAGERVVVDPLSLMSEEEKRQKGRRGPGPGARRKAAP